MKFKRLPKETTTTDKGNTWKKYQNRCRIIKRPDKN